MTRGTSGLLVTLALTSLVVLCGAAAQPTVARVGILTAGSGLPAMREVFHQGLRDLGYVEGHNLTVEQRQAGGQLEHLPALAAELVQGARDHGGPFGQAQVNEDVLRERGLEHAGDPDGPDLLDHRPPITTGWVGAARVPEILLNGHPAQGKIAADGDIVKLERGSRDVPGCL
jgi:hypothetical protein